MRAVSLIAALCGFGLVAAAAVGAHLVTGAAGGGELLQDPWYAMQLQASWERAITFGLLHVPPALIAARWMSGSRLALSAAWTFVAGVVLFSGVQLARLVIEAQSLANLPERYVDDASAAITAGPLEWAGFLVPVGGVFLHAAWLQLAVAAWIAKPKPAAT